MPLYEVTDGDRPPRLVDAHSPAGAEAYVRESIQLKVRKADYERVHELALKGIKIEGKARAESDTKPPQQQGIES